MRGARRVHHCGDHVLTKHSGSRNMARASAYCATARPRSAARFPSIRARRFAEPWPSSRRERRCATRRSLRATARAFGCIAQIEGAKVALTHVTGGGITGLDHERVLVDTPHGMTDRKPFSTASSCSISRCGFRARLRHRCWPISWCAR